LRRPCLNASSFTSPRRLMNDRTPIRHSLSARLRLAGERRGGQTQGAAEEAAAVHHLLSRSSFRAIVAAVEAARMSLCVIRYTGTSRS
jgi:hypothetical protein